MFFLIKGLKKIEVSCIDYGITKMLYYRYQLKYDGGTDENV